MTESSAPSTQPPQSAWSRGFTPFNQSSPQSTNPTNNGPSSSATGGASTASNWRGSGANGTNTNAGASASRWSAAPSSSSHQQPDEDSTPSSSRSWFDGHQQLSVDKTPSSRTIITDGHHNRKESYTNSSNAPAPATSNAGTSWRSNRIVDKSSSKPADSHSGSNSAQTTPAFNAQPAPTNRTNEVVYQPSDFGPADAPNVRWHYLDPQNQIQGPFPSSDMRLWYVNRFFDLKLPVQCMLEGQSPVANITKFIPLGVWFLHGNKAFLDSLPDIVEQGRKETPKDDSNSLTSGLHPSAAVLASDRNALSPVDESSSYAASVHQLVGDDDDNLNDVTELERYNSNSQPSVGPSAAGLNPTAPSWNQSRSSAPASNQNWQQPQQPRGAAPSSSTPSWSNQPSSTSGPRAPTATGAPQPNGTNGQQQPQPSSTTSPSANASASSLSLLQQQRLALQQQVQALPTLQHQYNQLHPLGITQFLQGLNLTQQQLSTLNQLQMQQLQAQFQTVNQQRAFQQQQIHRQIQQILLAQQQFQQQQQQSQSQQPQPSAAPGSTNQQLAYQQQQYLLMQQQQQKMQGGQGPSAGPTSNAYPQQQQQPPLPSQSRSQFGSGDAFGRPINQQPQQPSQQQTTPYGSTSPFQQPQPDVYGGYGQQQPSSHIGQRPGGYGQDLGKSSWSGQPSSFGGYDQQPLRDQFGHLAISQQQQMYEQQQYHAGLGYQQSHQQQPSDINQTIVYTPNQATNAEYQQQQQHQQQTAYQEEPNNGAYSQQPQQDEPQTEELQSQQQQHQPTTEEYTEEPAVAEEREEPTATSAEPQDATEAVEDESATAEESTPAVVEKPSVAPWAAKAVAETEKPKPKSLVEIQADEERAQKHKDQQLKDRQAAAARRTQPFNTAWGGQATPLSLTPDEHSTAQVIHANNALLPTPPSTTPSIKVLTPILSTVKQPRQPAGKIGKNGRRTEAAIVQMDATAVAEPSATTPTAAATTSSANTNAWGTKPAATTSAAAPVAKEPAPVVNAWATKRPPVVGGTPLSTAASTAATATPLLPNPSVPSLSMMNPPLLTIRPKSMQNLDGSAAPLTKPLNTVRILESAILDPQPRKSAPRTSSSRTTTLPSKKPPSTNDEEATNSAFGGPTMSAEFESWCKEHLAAISGADAYESLPQFLMTISSDEEARQYIHEYLGTSSQVDEFADEFLQLKAFESGKESTSKADDEDGKDKKRRRKKNQEF